MSTTDETAQQALPGIAEAVRFQRDLYLYWQCVGAASGLALTSKLYVSRPALRRVRARLAAADGALVATQDVPEVDDAQLLYLRRLLERPGLLPMKEGRAVAGRRPPLGAPPVPASWQARPPRAAGLLAGGP